MIKNFLNPIRGSKVTAILLKGWILSFGGASAGEGLPCSLRKQACFESCENIAYQLDVHFCLPNFSSFIKDKPITSLE